VRNRCLVETFISCHIGAACVQERAVRSLLPMSFFCRPVGLLVARQSGEMVHDYSHRHHTAPSLVVYYNYRFLRYVLQVCL